MGETATVGAKPLEMGMKATSELFLLPDAEKAVIRAAIETPEKVARLMEGAPFAGRSRVRVAQVGKWRLFLREEADRIEFVEFMTEEQLQGKGIWLRPAGEQR
ncbi:MAG: hypothetical protein K2W96_14975 [Gemmataceae bacterium]|nr:hypothetical protein [Gemmataceae bacterium]